MNQLLAPCALALILAAALPAQASPSFDRTAASAEDRAGDSPDHGPGGRPEGRRHGPHLSVERLALENLLAARLAARTGRSAEEITTLMRSTPPHELARQLGLEEGEGRTIFQAARRELIERASQAQLITAAQATELLSQPLPAPPRGR